MNDAGYRLCPSLLSVLSVLGGWCVCLLDWWLLQLAGDEVGSRSETQAGNRLGQLVGRLL